MASPRQEALRTGAKTYVTNKSCKRGHAVPRETKTTDCLECREEDKRKNQAKILWRTARKRADEKQLDFNITPEDIEEVWPKDDRCPVTRLPFSRERAGYALGMGANLDRILPSYGYVRGNIAILSRIANTIKQNCTDPTVFRNLADWLERVAPVNKVKLNRVTSPIGTVINASQFTAPVYVGPAKAPVFCCPVCDRVLTKGMHARQFIDKTRPFKPIGGTHMKGFVDITTKDFWVFSRSISFLDETVHVLVKRAMIFWCSCGHPCEMPMSNLPFDSPEMLGVLPIPDPKKKDPNWQTSEQAGGKVLVAQVSPIAGSATPIFVDGILTKTFDLVEEDTDQ